MLLLLLLLLAWWWWWWWWWIGEKQAWLRPCGSLTSWRTKVEIWFSQRYIRCAKNYEESKSSLTPTSFSGLGFPTHVTRGNAVSQPANHQEFPLVFASPAACVSRAARSRRWWMWKPLPWWSWKKTSRPGPGGFLVAKGSYGLEDFFTAGSPTNITHEKKGKWSEPNLRDYVPC